MSQGANPWSDIGCREALTLCGRYLLRAVEDASDAEARAVTDGATRAIYRYSKWPTQAITYNLGKAAITELREACRAKTGAAFSPREFHERFMREGSIPAAYIREQFLAACGAPAPP